jgi:hypothetical protein
MFLFAGFVNIGLSLRLWDYIDKVEAFVSSVCVFCPIVLRRWQSFGCVRNSVLSTFRHLLPCGVSTQFAEM